MHAGMIRLEEFLIDGRVDIALLSELSRSRLILSTGLGREEMVLVTRPGARPAGIVTGAELSRTQLVLGDGLRAAMDALLAGRGIELKVAIEVNDHETIRLMVTRGVAASILPYSSVARECAARARRGAPADRGGDFPDAGARGQGQPQRLAGARGRRPRDHRDRRRSGTRRPALAGPAPPHRGTPAAAAGGRLDTRSSRSSRRSRTAPRGRSCRRGGPVCFMRNSASATRSSASRSRASLQRRNWRR